MRAPRRIEVVLAAVALGLVGIGLLTYAFSARADEFKAVVVTEREAADLRAAKQHEDAAHAAFVKLRQEIEARYKSRFQSCCLYDWSTDFRVLAEPRPAMIVPRQWWQGYGSLTNIPVVTFTSPATLDAFADRAAPKGSVLTLNDGEIHGSFGGTVKLGEVPGNASYDTVIQRTDGR